MIDHENTQAIAHYGYERIFDEMVNVVRNRLVDIFDLCEGHKILFKNGYLSKLPQDSVEIFYRELVSDLRNKLGNLNFSHDGEFDYALRRVAAGNLNRDPNREGYWIFSPNKE